MLASCADVALLSEPFDVVVIGAGVVGLFCAIQLEKHGLRVAVIEGGDVVPDTACNGAYTRLVGRPHRAIEDGRAMGLGGTGLLWGGQLSEFSAADLDDDKGFWPVDYAGLRALYDRVYGLLHLPPRLADADARVQFGGDEGGVDGVERMFSYWLPDPNLAGLYRETISQSRSLTVFTNCKGIGFEFDAAGQARAVRVQTPDGTCTIAAGRFVLAAGVVESIRLVLAAQRQDDCPWRDNKQVGLAFQDHIGGPLGELSVTNERLFRDRFEVGFYRKTKYMPKLRYVGNGSGDRLSVCAFPVFGSSVGEHVANIKAPLRAMRMGSRYAGWSELPVSVAKIGTAFIPLVRRYLGERRVFALLDQGVDLYYQCEQMPRADSRIMLEDDGAPAADGLPRVVLDWRVGPDEGPFLRDAAQHYARYFAQTGCAGFRIDPVLLDDPAAFIARAIDTSHHCGGLRMGESAVQGVSDPNGRIWGSANVYVAGAAALATAGEANITLTALAMTLRLTDHLAGAATGEVGLALRRRPRGHKRHRHKPARFRLRPNRC
jgi:choline dehydrogenase-like flavoprotein